MTVHREVVLDEDGVPILTDAVTADVEPDTFADNLLAAMSMEDIVQTVVGSRSFRQQLDQVSTELTRQLREQLVQLLRPAIEQAITDAMDDSSVTANTIRQQLESALPAIISSQLQEIGATSSN
ncbi:MAG: hypothetical protein ABFS22_05560 [Pseudomonadota bacterium]